MEQKYTVGAIQFTVSEDGTLQYYMPGNGVREWKMNAQATFDFIAWLTAHQNYFALAKIQEDQRVAMLADIAGVEVAND